MRTIDRIDSKKTELNHEYNGSLDDPVIVDGMTVTPANTGAVLRVVELKNPKMGHASLSLTLVALLINEQRVSELQSGARAAPLLARGSARLQGAPWERESEPESALARERSEA